MAESHLRNNPNKCSSLFDPLQDIQKLNQASATDFIKYVIKKFTFRFQNNSYSLWLIDYKTLLKVNSSPLTVNVLFSFESVKL